MEEPKRETCGIRGCGKWADEDHDVHVRYYNGGGILETWWAEGKGPADIRPRTSKPEACG